MLSETVLELSRWQFALTALLHFLFIPLTLGLGLLLALLETAHTLSGRAVYLDQIMFWRRIFAVNFLLALSTRLTVILQFGMNGSYFAHYVGDVFALPLAIEALSSFFIAAALFGPYWFGRDQLSKPAYLLLNWLLVIALYLSAFWIMLANAWLQNPVGAAFEAASYRLELLDFNALLNNPIALGKFSHTLVASHAAAAAVVAAIAAWRLQQGPADEAGRITLKFAAIWGAVALLATAALPDRTAQLDTPVQQAKFAAMQGEPQTQVLAVMTRHIQNGIEAYALLEQLRDEHRDPQLLADFARLRVDLGYALLVKPWHKAIVGAKDAQIRQAAQSALPGQPKLLYWVNRVMIACGLLSLLSFALIIWQTLKSAALANWTFKLALYAAPLPWLACIAGWFVAEAGKQPWAVAGVLPLSQGISSASTSELLFSLLGYTLIYAALLYAGGCLLRQTLTGRPTNSTGEPS